MTLLALLVAAGCANSAKKPCVAAEGAPLTATFDGADADRSHHAVRLVPVLAKCGLIVDIQPVPSDDDLLLLVDQRGGLKWASTRDGSGGVVLTVTTTEAWEQGLLGVALHPRFAENGRLFLNYTVKIRGQLTSRVEEWALDPPKLRTGEARAVRTVYELAQPYGNHNAGSLLFGPDGKLYVPFGDGGNGGDPHGNGQNGRSALGTVLRLDVDRPGSVIPPDNPWVGDPAVLDEVWAIGMRNPWKMAFDSQGRLVAADVGQNAYEEITFVERGGNHGWNVREGRHCFPATTTTCRFEGWVEPFYEYGRHEGISITGGPFWMRPGSALTGRYLFGDYGTGRIWAVTPPPARDGPLVEALALGRFDIQISTFGVDSAQRVYVSDWDDETVYRLDEAPPG